MGSTPIGPTTPKRWTSLDLLTGSKVRELRVVTSGDGLGALGALLSKGMLGEPTVTGEAE
jgi:hypothetical protein